MVPVLFVLAIALVALGFWRNWIQWFFLCEVQWIGALFLLALPISAITIERSLVLGAYELKDTTVGSVTIGPSALLSGFCVALAVGLCAISIIWTAQLEFNLGKDRLQEKRPLGSPGWVMWTGGLLLAIGVLTNLAVTHYVSVQTGYLYSWGRVDTGLLLGTLLSVALLIAGEYFIGFLDGRFNVAGPPGAIAVATDRDQHNRV